MTDAEKIKEAYALLRSVNDPVVRFFSVAWGTIPSTITAGDRMIVEGMLKNHCYEAVRDAFLEARAQGKQSLSYVRTVAQNLDEKMRLAREREQADKSIAEARQKAIEVAKLTGENVRPKDDIGERGWRKGLLTENLSKEAKMITDILGAKQLDID